MVILWRTFVISSVARTFRWSRQSLLARCHWGQSVVERDFVVGQAEVFAVLRGDIQFFRKFDELLNNLLRGNASEAMTVKLIGWT